jgi:soluble P-type ATPase
MLIIDIPDYGRLELSHLVLDFNGTLAYDGVLLSGVAAGLTELAGQLEIHVLTADTFGSARTALAALPVSIDILPAPDQAAAKRRFIAELGAARTVAIGNGRNDRLMLEAAALGIAVVLEEGAASVTVQAADVVCTSIEHALGLLTHPQRLVATLRS